MKPPKKPVPILLKKKSLAQVSESYNCRICKKKKKILAPYTPGKNLSAPVCREKNFPAQGKIPAPLLI